MRKISIPLICAVLTSAVLAGEVEKPIEQIDDAQKNTTITTTTTTTTVTRREDAVVELVPEKTIVIRKWSIPVYTRYGREVIYEGRPGPRFVDDETRARLYIGNRFNLPLRRDGERRMFRRGDGYGRSDRW